MKRSEKKQSGSWRNKGRGALAIISMFLLLSAFLRGGDLVNHALALAPVPEFEADHMTEESCQSEDDLQLVLDAFREREARIKEQEAAIQARMELLRKANQENDKKLASLAEAEEKLRATIAIANSASETDVARLTKVYETMKPKQAAALFEEMSPEFAAGFLARMRPEAAAAIMAGLSPESAHSFSVVLAGRNAEVPRSE